MTSRAASCPNCGAPLVYRWSSSVQTVCEYCRSIVVRTDVDLKKVGQVADLPYDGSPIQLSTEGRYGDKGFVVAGRILYQYEQGTWNEWRIVLDGGADGWLSDAQNALTVSFLTKGLNIPTEAQAALRRDLGHSNPLVRRPQDSPAVGRPLRGVEHRVAHRPPAGTVRSDDRQAVVKRLVDVGDPPAVRRPARLSERCRCIRNGERRRADGRAGTGAEQERQRNDREGGAPHAD